MTVLLTAIILALTSPAADVGVPAAGTEGPSQKVLNLALKAQKAAQARGHGVRNRLITIIDYSLPSTRRRLWVIDPSGPKVLFHELVAHGKGTGENHAKSFSNESRSLASSIGLYETSSTYNGRHGYSLRLAGLEKGWNDRAGERDVVIHGAWYVSEEFAKKEGRLGRSWGCPALGEAVARKVIDTIKDGSLLLIYFPDSKWLEGSVFLK